MRNSSLLQFHDRVYVLTIARAVDRHRHMESNFPGWNLTFHQGLDCNDVTLEELSDKNLVDLEVYRRETGSELSLPSVCCTLGHRDICQRMLDEGLSRVLVLEDDVQFASVSESAVAAAVASTPTDFDLIYWGWTGGVYQRLNWPFLLRRAVYHLKNSIGLLDRQMTPRDRPYCVPYNSWFDRSGVHAGAFGYSVSRSGAQKIVDMHSPVSYCADIALTEMIRSGNLRAYSCLLRPISEHTNAGGTSLPSLHDPARAAAVIKRLERAIE